MTTSAHAGSHRTKWVLFCDEPYTSFNMHIVILFHYNVHRRVYKNTQRRVVKCGKICLNSSVLRGWVFPAEGHAAISANSEKKK